MGATEGNRNSGPLFAAARKVAKPMKLSSTLFGVTAVPSKSSGKVQDGVSLATIATNKIRDRILELALAPGMQLDETILRTTLGVSRTPAREALNRLVTEGLVENRNSKGFFVRTLDLDDVARLFDVYFIVERSNGTLCRFSHPNFVADMRAIQKRHQHAVEKDIFLDVTAANADFHVRIAESTDNSFLIDFTQRIHNYARRLAYFSYAWEAEDQNHLAAQQSRVVKDHQKIIRSISEKSRDALIDTLTAHAELFRARIVRFIQGHSTSEIAVIFRKGPRRNK